MFYPWIKKWFWLLCSKTLLVYFVSLRVWRFCEIKKGALDGIPMEQHTWQLQDYPRIGRLNFLMFHLENENFYCIWTKNWKISIKTVCFLVKGYLGNIGSLPLKHHFLPKSFKVFFYWLWSTFQSFLNWKLYLYTLIFIPRSPIKLAWLSNLPKLNWVVYINF